MGGPMPKDPATRQRRNRKSTKASLPAQKTRKSAPTLPEGEWTVMAQAFWKDVWASPMAEQYLDADVHGLYMLTELVDRFWRQPSTALASEIRQQRMAYGLTPIDRRRLEWSVKNDAETGSKAAPGRVTDSRTVLKVIA